MTGTTKSKTFGKRKNNRLHFTVAEKRRLRAVRRNVASKLGVSLDDIVVRGEEIVGESCSIIVEIKLDV